MAEEKKQEYASIIRIMSKDVPGGMSVYSGLTRVKGISWNFSNAICTKLNIDKRKKIGELTQDEISKITEFVKKPDVPVYLMNRRNDLETGENKHLQGSDLDLRKEFDIKRLKKMKSYKGVRHASGLPVNGQRTKSNFRRNRRKGTGIKKKK
ncbi:MAG TPA: 30S ribosomal protein S13 [Candidatus Nanoarchaeia archaeon]|nr:30S ribosomal protein S13 [Candidatus Nanoarchaeia archaeon]